MTTADGRVLGTTQIFNSSRRSARINLAVLSDGYQLAEMPKFAADAYRFLHHLLTTPPFDTGLALRLNVFRIDVVSTDSGADDPLTCGGAGTTAATYFDATYCGNGLVHRNLAVSVPTVLDVVEREVPEAKFALVLVNSSLLGGAKLGGGPVAITAAQHPGADDTAVHELGHLVFELADEYDYSQGCKTTELREHHPGPEPVEVNVTLNDGKNLSTLKWGDLVSATRPTTTNPNCSICDPQPSPVPAGSIGTFEGADTWHCGAFRPEFDCKMRHDSQPFCTVCTLRIRETLNGVAARDLSVVLDHDRISTMWAVSEADRLRITTKFSQRAYADWRAWTEHPSGPPPRGAHQSAPAPLPNGALQLWVVTSAGQIWTTWQRAPVEPGINVGATIPAIPHAPFEWRRRWEDYLHDVGPLPPVAAKAVHVAVAPLSDGALELWVVDDLGGLWTTWKTSVSPSASWQKPWEDFFDPAVGAGRLPQPAVAVQTAVAPLPNGALHLWAVDAAGGLWTTWKTSPAANASWEPWKDFLGEVGPLPGGIKHVSVAPQADGRLRLWAIAGTRDLLFSTQKLTTAPNSKWSGWENFFAEAGILATGLQMTAVAQLSDQSLELWAVDRNGAVYTTWEVKEAEPGFGVGVAVPAKSTWKQWLDFLNETGAL